MRGLPVLASSALLLLGSAWEIFASSDRAQRDGLASMLAAGGFILLGVGIALAVMERRHDDGSDSDCSDSDPS